MSESKCTALIANNTAQREIKALDQDQRVIGSYHVKIIHPRFRIREFTRPSGYWVYLGFIGQPDYTNYYEAIKRAIEIEKESGISNWVELITE